ncbi:von Willebrand factor A [Clostridium botulinum C/D str. BKT12695]|nr:von Willebrand factor A [Clostridium botulinum C/D str. BKT12695]
MRKLIKVASIVVSLIFTVTELICIPTFAEENLKRNNLTSQFELKQNINSNNYTVDESFNINYDISSLMGIDKNDYDAVNSKDKEIVLVVDTSGSMNDRNVEGKYKINYSAEPIFSEEEYPWYRRVSLGNGQKYIIHELIDTPEREIKIGKETYNEYIEINKKRYYLKYDYSDGNWYAIAYSEPKIDELQKAAKNFVNKFETKRNTKIGLVSYANNGDIIHSLTNELERINSSIDFGLTIGGGTNVGDGIRMANGLLNNGSDADKYIVLMTDGMPTAATCYNDIYYKNNRFYSKYGEILNGNGNPLSYFNYIGNYKYKFEYNPNDYTHEDEKIIMNYGDNDYGNIALNYSKEALKRASESGVNNFVIGFSNGINREKLNGIATEGNGYYREAMHGDELTDVYKRIADEINNPVVKNIEFKLNLPDGLVIEDVIDTNSKSSVKDKLNVNISNNGRSIKFKLDNISYNEEKDENGNIKYVVSKDQLEKFKFSIKVKANKSGEYVLGDNTNYGAITYTDVNGASEEKRFKIEKFNVKDGKEALSVDKMGLILGKNDLNIIEKDIKLMNGFRYKVSTIINIGDGQKAEEFIQNDNILKSSILNIKTVGKSNLKLYSIEDNKLQLVKGITNINNNEIKIPKNTLKKNGKYILIQDIITNEGENKEYTIENSIELQNDKNKISTKGNMKANLMNCLPNLD